MVRETFEVSGDFHLQYYDTEVKEWIDLDGDNIHELDETEKFYKIKVIEEIENVIIIDETGSNCSTSTKMSESFEQLPALSSPSRYSIRASTPRSSTPCSTLSEESVARCETPESTGIEVRNSSRARLQQKQFLPIDMRKLVQGILKILYVIYIFSRHFFQEEMQKVDRALTNVCVYKDHED